MKQILLAALLAFCNNYSFGQNKLEAEKLVSEGVAYHDKGDYDGAIKRYDEALKLDKDNLLAMSEKALSLVSLEKNEEAINYCKTAIEKYGSDKGLNIVYVTYGNALDAQKKTDQSIEIYNEGIKKFPNYYQLYFNKGITLASVKRNDEALQCFKKAIILNPEHPSSNNAVAWLTYMQGMNIPAILAFSRILVVEPLGKRAEENLSALQKLMSAHVEKTGENKITINMDAKLMDVDKKNAKAIENDFSTTEMILSLEAALDFDSKNADKTEVENFIRKFETICSSLKESQKGNYGFYWKYYAPYFIAIKDKKMTETFAHIVFASSDKPEINSWLKTHKLDVDNFYAWDKNFDWKTN